MTGSPGRPSKRERRMTSHDVAASAGVSQATVTRAFTSPQLLAEPTLERVLLAAVRLGYVPNAIARSLKSQRSRIVGVVMPAEGEYYQRALTEMSRQLSSAGQQLLLFTFEQPGDIDDVLASVLEYQVDGVVLSSSAIGVRQIERMIGVGPALVAFNQPAAAGLVPTVSVDNEAGTGELARYLLEMGHKTVTFVGGIEDIRTDQLRYAGAARVLGDVGVPCRYVAAGAYSYRAGRDVVGQILGRPLPDAVMVASDEIAFGVIDGLRTEGVDVPGDVSITGFDGLPQTDWAPYDLTTIQQPISELVAATVEILTGRTDTTEVFVPGRLRVGTTVRASGYLRGRRLPS